MSTGYRICVAYTANRGGDGLLTGVLMDDYRESYLWLRHHTPHHSRVLAWWDYGYQISAIANRTTLADGNTWNQGIWSCLFLALPGPLSFSLSPATTPSSH